MSATKLPHFSEVLTVRGKTILVRVDFNVHINDGIPFEISRLHRAVPSISTLLGGGARVVLLSHRGRPRGRPDPSLSLQPVARAFASVIQHNVPVIPLPPNPSPKPLPPLCLMENLRFSPEEEANSPEFARQIADSVGADLFVMDAFSISHRPHSSVVQFPQFLPSYAGFALFDELNALETLLQNPKRPLLALVGGAKVSDKAPLLEALLKHADEIHIAGLLAEPFLHLKNPRSPKPDPHDVDVARRFTQLAAEQGKSLILPSDLTVARPDSFDDARNVPAHDVPSTHRPYDTGPETFISFSKALQNAKTFLWNGPVGFFERHPFNIGTIGVARLASHLVREGKLVAVAGGGETVAAIRQVVDSFSLLSTGGGSFLQWLQNPADPPLPALTALLSPLNLANQSKSKKP